MPEITANTTDGYQASGLTGGWDNTHDKELSLQGLQTSAQSEQFFGPRAEFNASRSSYFIVRTFFDFDVSSISANVTEATFSVMTENNGGNDIIVLKSGHDPSDTGTTWFTTWLTGLSGTISGWGTSSTGVTAFSSNVTQAADENFTNITLNAAALSHLNSIRGTSNLFKITVLNYDYDYLDVDPNPGGGGSEFQYSGIYFADSTDSAKRPHLDYTTGDEAEAEPIEVNRINVNGGLNIKGGNLKIL
tara:strand:- start:66 stop:806 length:741 start_codon:yes stop_codon:yes gene_type:complete